MLIFGVIVIIIGCVQFWQRERWVRQAVVIMDSFGLKSWATKPAEFWTRWEIAGNILFWVIGLTMIITGVVSMLNGKP